jgi:hypothetical protein
VGSAGVVAGVLAGSADVVSVTEPSANDPAAEEPLIDGPIEVAREFIETSATPDTTGSPQHGTDAGS